MKQSGNNFKHFHSKMFKSFAFVLDTFCTKEELSAYEIKKKKKKKKLNLSMSDRRKESKKISCLSEY